MKIAARHRRHRKNRKEKHSLARQRKKGKRRSLISLLPPPVASHRGQRISRALAYFVSPNEGLVVVHGTSRPTKKSKTSPFISKACLLTVLCRRDPAWTHLVPWMRNISYSRCLFWVCSAWIRKISLYLRTKDRIEQKNNNYEQKDFLIISTSQNTCVSLELACVESAG